MNFITSFLLRAVAVVLTTVAMAAPIYAADPIVIKFSHVAAPDSPKGQAARRFKETAERRSNGKVKVEVYPNSTLYKEKDEIDALLAGNVQLLAPSLARFEELGIKEFDVFNVPYIFPGKDMLRRITDKPDGIGQQILKSLEPKGIVGLAYWDNGFKAMITNKPIRKPMDLKGLKMRISAPVHAPLMKALGATALEIPFSKVAEGLKTGEVDGADNVPSNIYSQKMHEMAKYVTLTDHVYLGYVVIANKKFWDGLAPDVRISLKLAIIDATRYANLFAERENDDALTKIKASGKAEVTQPSIDERNAWRKALLPVHKQFEARVGKELMQVIYKEGAALGYKY